jgi:hypothetical protein
MIPLVVIALLIGLPILLIFWLRANGALVLLALCAGSVLQRFVSSDASTILNSFTSRNSSASDNLAQLILLFLPALLTVLLLRKGISGSKAMINLVPAAGTGILAALLAVPLLPGGLRHNIVQAPAWAQVNQYQSVIVAAAMLVSFLLLWMTYPKPAKDKHKK